jgi:hypothetical protein
MSGKSFVALIAVIAGENKLLCGMMKLKINLALCCGTLGLLWDC